MSDRMLIVLSTIWLSSLIVVSWSYMHPTFNWTPQEVARDAHKLNLP